MGAQAHYLGHVMRMGVGEPVLLFNGRDGEWVARIERQGRHGCALVVAGRSRRQRPEPGPWLVFAPVKKTATDFIVEKATELGASRLWPVLTERTVASRVNAARLRAHAVEAAEQCERLTVPEMMDAATLSDMVQAWPPDRPLLVVDEHGRGLPIAHAVAPERPAETPAAGLLVGPEGGFTTSELDALDRLPFVTRTSLGPRILRAETAALAALACWQALAGDWTERPPRRGDT